VVRSEEGYFGGTVHKAARLVALAKPGQILTTRSTLDRLGARWQRAARYFDRRVLRGDSGEEEIHEILWDASATSISTGVGPRPEPGACGAALLEHEGQRVRVDATRPRAELGRDPACDLRVASGAVSRVHATVDWGRERILVTDLSTNGTTVEREGEPPVRLHRESGTLAGNGVLRLGAGNAPDAVVRYRCTAEGA
jgi:hypothetical protein